MLPIVLSFLMKLQTHRTANAIGNSSLEAAQGLTDAWFLISHLKWGREDLSCASSRIAKPCPDCKVTDNPPAPAPAPALDRARNAPAPRAKVPALHPYTRHCEAGNRVNSPPSSLGKSRSSELAVT